MIADLAKISIENSVKSINFKNGHMASIAQIDNMEYCQQSIKKIAKELQRKIQLEEITDLLVNKIEETVVTVAVDSKTGKVYYGISGFNNNPTRRDIEENALWLNTRLEEFGESKEIWSLDNCGEYNAINNALNDGAQINNLQIYSVYISDGVHRCPCKNCKNLYRGYVKFIK